MANALLPRRDPGPEPSNLRLPEASGGAGAIARRWPAMDEDAARAARVLADEALIAEALAAGQVTVCPPGRALNAGELKPVRNPLLARGVMSTNWRSGKGQA